MSTLPSIRSSQRPPIGLGMTALVLGTVGMMLCIFPILGIPISALGALCGLLGLGMGLSRGGVILRWTLEGIALSAVALAVNVAIAYAPAGYRHDPEVPQPWQPPPGRPYVPPPSL